MAAENEYGDVASQIGGKDVAVTSVESNPNTDPHTYEVSPGVAKEVASAQLLIQNGVGYDDFMTKIAAASPNPNRLVINVQHLLFGGFAPAGKGQLSSLDGPFSASRG